MSASRLFLNEAQASSASPQLRASKAVILSAAATCFPSRHDTQLECVCSHQHCIEHCQVGLSHLRSTSGQAFLLLEYLPALIRKGRDAPIFWSLRSSITKFRGERLLDVVPASAVRRLCVRPTLFCVDAWMNPDYQL